MTETAHTTSAAAQAFAVFQWQSARWEDKQLKVARWLWWLFFVCWTSHWTPQESSYRPQTQRDCTDWDNRLLPQHKGPFHRPLNIATTFLPPKMYFILYGNEPIGSCWSLNINYYYYYSSSIMRIICPVSQRRISPVHCVYLNEVHSDVWELSLQINENGSYLFVWSILSHSP